MRVAGFELRVSEVVPHGEVWLCTLKPARASLRDTSVIFEQEYRIDARIVRVGEGGAR